MKTIFVATAALLLTGCASLMTADEQSIKVVSSTNTPIEVTIDDKTTTTPGTVVVLRDGKDKVVTSAAAGCQNATPVKKSVTPVFFGNIVIGGLLGSTTDASTGKMWDYQDSVEVTCSAQ